MRPLTTYFTGNECSMLSNVLCDMMRGKIEHAVVQVSQGVEVWRTGMTDYKTRMAEVYKEAK